MSLKLFSMDIRSEQDAVMARQRARQIAEALGFKDLEQIYIATAASEIIRNALIYAGGGRIEYLVEGKTQPQMFLLRISDQGPEIKDLSGVAERGSGLANARRLLDHFHIETAPGRGTTVLLGSSLPREAPAITADDLARITLDLARHMPHDHLTATVWQQQRELLRALEELFSRQEELSRVNRELDDTNRGVMALYAELEEKAEHLRQADQLKTRFLSDMSHEFRTPINSILALSQILLERTDGELTPEQEKQLTFISKAANDLSDLVNDLLDLARIEAGKTEVRIGTFDVATLFSTIRGIMRPLLSNESVSLIFEDPGDIPSLTTDEGKVSQILRNFISNAIKFTEQGEIRVSAAVDPAGGQVTFSVADTGIGIAPEDQERIFQEFTQLENPLQRKRKGTGLGLSLSRKLAALLGGSIGLVSRPGTGSTFSLSIPLVHREKVSPSNQHQIDPTRFPVLVIEDDPKTLYTYEKYLSKSDFQVIPARNLDEARQAMNRVRPAAIILDILLPGEDGWSFLTEIKEHEATWQIPVLVVSIVNEPEKGMMLGADDYCVKPVNRQCLLTRLRALESFRPLEKILIIDDEEVSRYLLKGLLADTRYRLIEAVNGQEGLRLAIEEQPQAIFLDLVMPGMDGFEVLDRLKAEPATRDIPVIIITSKDLDEDERSSLRKRSLDVISKGASSREETMSRIREALIEVIHHKEHEVHES